MQKWYAVVAKPRQERVADENLQRQEFETYLPLIQLQKRRRGKWEEVIEPLFPRYLFVHVDPDVVSVGPIRSTKGVAGLVRFGMEIKPVPDEVMDFLLRTRDPETGIHLPDQSGFKENDPVTVVDGPFAGLRGIFQKTRGEDRVMVLLEFLGRTNVVTLKRDAVIPAED